MALEYESARVKLFWAAAKSGVAAAPLLLQSALARANFPLLGQDALRRVSLPHSFLLSELRFIAFTKAMRDWNGARYCCNFLLVYYQNISVARKCKFSYF